VRLKEFVNAPVGQATHSHEHVGYGHVPASVVSQSVAAVLERASKRHRSGLLYSKPCDSVAFELVTLFVVICSRVVSPPGMGPSNFELSSHRMVRSVSKDS
jgi:hypothetical protein